MPIRTLQTVLAASIVVGLIAGCGTAPRSADGSHVAPSTSPSASPNPSPTPSTDPSTVHADELGQVPVLMVHQVEQHPSGDYAQTPAQLTATLEYLARQNYVAITAADLVTGELDVPAGASPVVLTFDDSYPDQFTLRSDGTVDPDCAVGVVRAVAAAHPRFRGVGTMYVNHTPFGSHRPARELTWLRDHGWEIGNHTETHADLSTLSSSAVQGEIGREQLAISRAVPGYQVRTMALPFGSMPGNATLAHRGSWQQVRYRYLGVMLVGANPAPSPFSTDWNPYAIPRIRSWHGRIDMDEHYWLPRLTRNRYVSDGNPHVISYPRTSSVTMARAFRHEANPY